MKKNNCSDCDNIEIICDASVIQLVEASTVVIGFNSTTLLEALVAKKTVLTFDFSDFGIRSFFDEYPESANFIRSSADLDYHVSDIQRAKRPAIDEMNNLLLDRVYLPDGLSSKRLGKEIINLI